MEVEIDGAEDAVEDADFGADEETVISNQFDRPVVVHRYPMDLKAFYFARDPHDSGLALNMDVLAPEGYGEIIGGEVSIFRGGAGGLSYLSSDSSRGTLCVGAS